MLVKPIIIVSDFLPNKNGGTIRAEKNVKYFKKAGVLSVIFTQKKTGLLKRELVEDILIYRTCPYDLGKFYVKLKSIFNIKKIWERGRNIKQVDKVDFRNKGRLADAFFVPDIDILWAIFSNIKFKRVVRESKINIVYSSGPSHSTHIIPLLSHRFLKRRKIPWVAEFRDPWILNPFREAKNKILDKIDNFLEAAVIKKSDLIIVTSNKYKTDFVKKYGLEIAEKIKFIPNGFDSNDFSFLTDREKEPKKKFRIISTGNYYNKRTLVDFLKLVKEINQTNESLIDNFEFIQYGSIDKASEIFLSENKLENVIIKSFIPHKECIEQMFQSDLLLLIPGPGDGTMPGKTFEYLASGTKVLGFIDDSPSKDLILRLNAGVVFNTHDYSQAIPFLKEVILTSSNNNNHMKMITLLKEYDREKIAVDILDSFKKIQ